MSSYISMFNPIKLGMDWFFYKSAKDYIKKPSIESIRKYELLILCIDGVLKNNNEAIPLAVETFNKLKNELNTKLCLLTNECRYPPQTIRKQLISMGFDIDTSVDIVSASSLVLITLSNILKLRHINSASNLEKETENYNSGYISRKRYKRIVNTEDAELNKAIRHTKFGIIADDELFNYLANSITKKYKHATFYHIKKDLSTNNIPENLDYIVIGTLENSNKLDQYLNNSVQWLLANPNVAIILAHTDTNTKIEDTLCPVSVLNSIKEHGKKDNSEFKLPDDTISVGKPYCSEFIDKFMERYKLDKSGTARLNILVVGDDYDCDMKFAENVGCDKCLVLTGNITSDELVKQKYDISGIEYIIPDVSYLAL